MGIELVMDATVEPISLEIAWSHLNIEADGSPESSAHDAWLEYVGLPAAREMAERFTGLCMAPKRYRLMLDEFPDGAIELAHPPLDSIVSVEYVDSDGELQTLDPIAYTTDKGLPVPWLLPAFGATWPTTAEVANAVRVTFDAGYTAETLPKSARAGILLLIGHLFRNREAVTDRAQAELPIGVEWALRPLRVRLGVA